MTDALELPLELERASDRFERQQDRIAQNQGEGDTEAGLAIARKFLPKLAEAYRSTLGRDLTPRYHPLKRQLVRLEDEVLALCSLQTMFHCAAHQMTLRDTYRRLSTAVVGELWALEFQEWSDTKDAQAKKDGEYKPRIAARVSAAVRRKHGSRKYRAQAGRSLAAHHGFDDPDNKLARLICGEFLVGVTQNALPGIFEFVEKPHTRGERVLMLTDEAMGIADAAIAEAVLRKPVWLPVTEAPPPWTTLHEGGTWDQRLQPSLTLVRYRHKDTAAAVRAAIHDGRMKPALEAVNSLQNVPWAINHRVLGVMRACMAKGIEVPGLVSGNLLPSLEAPEDWDSLSERERKVWKIKASNVKLANLRFKSEGCLQAEDVRTAEYLAEHERFWTAMNLDWRGRVYAVPNFNFQRDDRVRALFLFADGEPIGEEGLYWLKVHVANCGDFGKISKRPFEERVQWVDDHLTQIEELSWTTLSDTSLSWWTQADKPFLFLAACMELQSALTTGPTYVSRLPLAFDGSCSGLQHLCAMTRAQEGTLVNLTKTELPQDVYQVVADGVKERVSKDADTAPGDAAATNVLLSKQCLAYGITRSLVKRNVMTYSYSSKKYGMGHQHIEDTMRPLSFQVLCGKLTEHPFGDDEGRAASKYLAGHVYDTIEEIVNLPAQAMGFLRTIAKVLAHEGKPVRWTTPIGLPWINRYHEADCRRITLWMHDRGVNVPIKLKYAVGDKKAIDKDRAANGVSPNFVHALDASHLLLVVNASVQEGVVGLATVHDSFGCLASRAGRFRSIIREQFVALYSLHAPLAEVLKQAREDLTADSCTRLPALPAQGPLNIEEVLNAEFAFA